jgi:hypothetical protein
MSSSIFKHSDFKKEAEYLQQKREAAIAYLGDKWLLAKSNHVQKKVKKNDSSPN